MYKIPQMLNCFCVSLLLLPMVATPLRAQESRAFTTEDALNIAQISIEALTPDGRFVAATRWTSRDRKNVDHMRFGDPTYIAPSFADVLVIDASTGNQTPVFDSKVQTRAFDWSPDGKTLAFFYLDGEQYSLYTYDREHNQTRKVDLRTSKNIASNSPLEWRPDGTGILVTLRAEGWAEISRKAYENLTYGPTIVQDSSEPFLAWDAVRNRGQLSIPAIVELPSQEVRELFDHEVSLQNISQSEDGNHISYLSVDPTTTSYTRQDGTDYSVHTLNLADRSTRLLKGESD